MKAFTIVDHSQTKAFPKSRDRHTFVDVNPDDLTQGEMTPADQARLLKSMQDNSRAATEPFRTNPLLAGELHCNVAANANTNITIQHGLAEPYGHWWPVGARPNSAPFQAVEIQANAAYPQTKYLLLRVSSTGTYDIVITPK